MKQSFKDVLDSLSDEKQKAQVECFIVKEMEKFAFELDQFALSIGNGGEQLINEKCLILKRLVDSIVLKGENCMDGVDKKVSAQVRAIFREIRPEYYYASEIVRKGYLKPRGYPGDFEMMNYVYNNSICSETLMGRYWDYYFVNDAYAVAVRGRKNKMVDILQRAINDSKKSHLRILNLPCGPARDIEDLLKLKNLRRDVKVDIVCVDQDPEALEYGKQSVKNNYANIEISFQQGDILNFVRRPEKFGKVLGEFDLVYSIGLADYLPDKLLKNMLLFSWGLLTKDGKVIYAFKIHDKDPVARLPPKWFCDWQFVPRGIGESSNLFVEAGLSSLDPIEWEDSGRIGFFTSRKL